MSPRPHLLARILAVAATAAALAAPAAIARPIDGPYSEPVRGTTAAVEPSPSPPTRRSCGPSTPASTGARLRSAPEAPARSSCSISLGGVAYTSHNRIGAAR